MLGYCGCDDVSQPAPVRYGGAAELARPCKDRQALECLLNPRVGHRVALNHERLGRLGCLVRVAGIEGRGRVVLDPELDSLRDLRPGKFGDNSESKINPCRDATRREDIRPFS